LFFGKIEAVCEIWHTLNCFQDETVTVELKSGIAEIFGTEMVLNTKYTFRSGAKFAVFTYHGCQILVRKLLEF
jgi:polyribonucleotide 5'-hydroxyl-kinase